MSWLVLERGRAILYINSANLVSEVREQAVEYEEKNHCFDIEKPLFNASKSKENSGNCYLNMENSLFNAPNSEENEKNHCFNDGKALFKTTSQHEPHCFEMPVSTTENKYMLYKKLEELQVNKSIGSVTALNIKAIIETFSGQEIFGRKEIKQKLGYKDSKAGFLIQTMREFELIKAVKGRGKGKYCFDI